MDPNNPFHLTLHERERTPIELIENDNIILNCPTEFKCSICWELFRETHITKNCLHRFCRNCIITALRQGNKECPVCRENLPSKRDLRPDPEFDAMLQIFYPDRANYEKKSDDRMEKFLQESYSHLNFDRKTRKPKKENNNSDAKEEIEVELQPRPDSDYDITSDQSRYISIAKTASVDHITKYLSQVPKFPYDTSTGSGTITTGAITATVLNSPPVTPTDNTNVQTTNNVQFNIYSYTPDIRQYTRIPGHILLSELDRNSDGFIVLYYQRVSVEDEDDYFGME